MRSVFRKSVLLIASFVPLAIADAAAGDIDRVAPASVYQYEVDEAHSEVGFKVRHLGIANVTGSFGRHETHIEFDPDDLTSLRATTVVQTASVNTGIEKRDNHLRSDDFFNAEQYPEIRFVSRQVTDLESDGTFRLHGDLTIRDVTRPIVLDAEFRGPLTSMGKERVAFSAEGELNRFDYGLKWNKAIETGGLVVSENVKLVIEIEAFREIDTGASN